MARAKRTDRAEARRRHRAAQTAGRRPATDEEDAAADDAADAAQGASAEPRPRPALRLPDVRADLAALPGIFRRGKAIWLAVALLLSAFFVAIAPIPDPGAQRLAQTYIGFILPPPALVPIFIGGFFAPRASYLVGLVLGILDGLLLLLLVVLLPSVTGGGSIGMGLTLLGVSALSGLAFGWFAAWYRDFLRGAAQRRRAAQEQRARAQRREAKRTARQTR